MRISCPNDMEGSVDKYLQTHVLYYCIKLLYRPHQICVMFVLIASLVVGNIISHVLHIHNTRAATAAAAGITGPIINRL